MSRRVVVMSRAGTVLVILAALGVGACGSPAGPDGIATLQGAPSTPTTAGGGAGDGEIEVEEALLAFAACMREQGIDLPDPEVDVDGNVRLMQMISRGGLAAATSTGEDQLRAAAEACRGHLEGVALRFASIDRTDLQDRLLAYAGCMRNHGFDLPDPDFSAGEAGPGMAGIFPGIGVDVFADPAFQEAHEVCEGIFAGLVPGAGAEGFSGG